MKHYTKLFFAAVVAALGLASCAKEVAPVETPKDNLVTVHFGATAGIEGATKATLTTEDELTFKSAWENRDELSVEYISPETGDNKTVTGTWTGSGFKAEGLPNETGAWDYAACYPVPDSKDSHIDFGANRTQNGNSYNSIYDVMIGNKSTKNSAAGKDDDGRDIVFNMDRKTAVVYFHLTGGPADEDLVSATLSVEDGFIASQYAYISNFTFAPTEDLKEITITFPEKAPKASDFQLWYNVLPTTYTKMALTVETANHTLTISRTAEGMYEAGKLYKVSKSILADKWAPKAAYTGGDLVFDFKTVKPEGWPASKDKALAGTYKYAVNGVDYSFILGKGVYCAGTTPNSAYLIIAKSSSLGLPAIAGYKLTKVIGTLNNTGSPSTKAEICITDDSSVVPGGTAQTWDTKGKDYTYTLAETEENTVYYLSVSSTANCQMTKLVLSYEPATPSAPKYAVSFASVEGGTLSASAIKAEEGTEITLTAEPLLGYEFNNDWSVTATDGTIINVVDNKFTMPAQNVTVSGTFSKVAYTITKAAAENGSFIVKNGDAEVTTAFKGDKITLEATPVEGFTFGKWTVTYMDGETEQTVNVNANAFYMPAANVTVSATFVEAAQVPVYASVADLITAGTPTKDGTKVTVTLMDEEIIRFHTLKDGTVAGAIIKVGKQEVEIFCKGTPSDWKVGGTISGTLTNCDWKLFYSTWELCPADYSELTYKAPLPTCATPVITIAEDGVALITCETVGATIHYTVGDAPEDPTEADDVFGAVTLTDGQTIKAIAVAENHKPSAVASKKYTAGGAALTEKTATINFGTKKVNINKATITGDDSEKNSWTITTVGTTSFSSQPTYSQVGSKDKPAKSITFTTTLPKDAEVTSISAKFGGNGSTAGTITLKVGEASVGTGALNGTNDVTVTSTSTAVGNKVTITVTNIARGVKCYNIQVTYKTAN